MDLLLTFILLIAVSPACLGCYLTLDAGRREGRGDLGAARREIRLGGFLICGGAVGVLVVALVALVSCTALPSSPLFVTAALACLGGSAFTALLAALSGKPRPSGTFAVMMFLAGVVGLFWALRAC